MKRFAIVVTVTMAALSLPVFAATSAAQDHPRVGEVRAFAVAPANQETVAQLHRDGWLEANGRLLPVATFKALYQQIGRTWTAAGVSEDRFAIPQLRDTTQRPRFYDNPYGVLSAGDLVTSGRVRPIVNRSNALTYWIFVGQDVSRVDLAAR